MHGIGLWVNDMLFTFFVSWVFFSPHEIHPHPPLWMDGEETAGRLRSIIIDYLSVFWMFLILGFFWIDMRASGGEWLWLLFFGGGFSFPL